MQDLRVPGWDPFAAPAEQSARSEKGTFASMMMATVESIEATLPTEIDPESMCVEGSIMIHQTIRMRGISIHVIVVYFRDKIGLTGFSVHLIEEIAKVSPGRSGFSFVVGDFNIKPDVMINSGYPDMVDMDVVH